ncbi:Ubiquitin carboxyl-terminal hydrolase 22 [Taenia solium]|eukprot:TsM_000130400 transcript=TsM_000130400 gene=TsM_000130400
MSCKHVENFLSVRTNFVAVDAVLRFVVFPISEKAIKYKSSLSCHYCHDFPVNSQRNRPISLLACAHCIHFSCFTNQHIEDHVKSNPDHNISICLDQGELYCSICHDFVYCERIEAAYRNALSMYTNKFGRSERPWRPSYKELEYVPYLKSVCLPVSASHSRRESCGISLFESRPFLTTSLDACLLETRGLVNMGNTCFLNVVVQALTHTPVLRDFLLSDLHRCDNPTRSRNCLACEMIRITQEIYRPVLSPYVPSNLLHSIWLHARHLAGYEQRDAHEFLITLLTLIHSHLVGEQAPREDDMDETLQHHDGSSTTSSTKRRWHDSEKLLMAGNGGSRGVSPECLSNSSQHEKKFKSSPSSVTSSTTGEMDERSAPTSPVSSLSDRTEIVTNDSNNNNSRGANHTATDTNCDCIVHQVFFGDLESVISYRGCDHRSSTVDPFLDLSLDVAQRGSTSLAACLSSYFRPEAIDGLLLCSQCNINRPAVKQFSLLHLPTVRCHHDTKINTSISFPVELDLTPFVAQLADRQSSWYDRYSLYAVLNHSGQTNSGHYTAFIRSGPGCWCLCDDQKIVPVTLERVLTTDAYVLLYHKNFLAPNSPSPTPSANSAAAPSGS